jgi:tRNA(Ile)-lysidine synthase
VDELAAQPAPVRRRVLRAAAVAAGAPGSELFHQHLLAMDSLITDWHGQHWIEVPGHLRLRRHDGRLIFERNS